MDEWNRNRTLHPEAARWERDEPDQRKGRRREEEARRKENLDEALDRALEESFPGSDPISVTQPPEPVPRRKAKR